jgi:hypothetical protein
MKNDEEPKVWITFIKLVVGAAVLIGGVGLALWWASERPVYSPALEQAKEAARATSPKSVSTDSWGIVNDSPVRNNR